MGVEKVAWWIASNTSEGRWAQEWPAAGSHSYDEGGGGSQNILYGPAILRANAADMTLSNADSPNQTEAGREAKKKNYFGQVNILYVPEQPVCPAWKSKFLPVSLAYHVLISLLTMILINCCCFLPWSLNKQRLWKRLSCLFLSQPRQESNGNRKVCQNNNPVLCDPLWGCQMFPRSALWPCWGSSLKGLTGLSV